MTVKQLIEQLQQLDPEAECVFAEYTSQQKTLLWYLGLCCNTDHQREQKQVWFNRNLLVQEQIEGKGSHLWTGDYEPDID